MPDILADLNPAQRTAVTAPDGPVLVVAGAGSGKTRVLTTRIAWLLSAQGLHPAAILAFTFTNRAAREMRERVARLVGPERAPRWVGTFHATGVRILRREGHRLGLDRGFAIYDTDDQTRLLKEILVDLRLDPKQYPPRQVGQRISRWKNEDTAPAEARRQAATFVEETMAAAYERYERGLRRCNAVDFDDLILRTVHLLEEHEEVRLALGERFRHVLVDEFQDTNPLQLVLSKALSSVHGNIFAVGDDDQAIYSWRGACVENMLRFEEYFPGTTLLRLEQNYRSTGNILAAANAVIAHNRRRKGKTLWTEGAAGDLLRVEGTPDAEDEASQLVDVVRGEIMRGTARRDVTVLYRTNAQSRLLEDALRRASIPHHLVGSVQFYERREVRDVLAYLKLVANPADRVSALRVINVPRRKIGDATVAKLLELADAEGTTLGEAAARPELLESRLGPSACRRVRDFFGMIARWRAAAPETPVPRLLERILQETGYGAHLDAEDPEGARARHENVAELLNATHAFDEATEEGRLPQFLEQVALVADSDALDASEGAVRLMTIHTAKGLEFPVVVIAGCEEDLLPHVSSLAEEATLEEERRLFYVALTRARERVYLLHAARRRRFGTYEDCLPSRFLVELPPELIERREIPGLGLGAGAAPSGPARGRPSLGGAGGTRGAPHRRDASGRGAGPVRGPRPVRPGEWGTLARGAGARGEWHAEVNQVEVRFHPGQAVTHATYGAGVVVRVEGVGDDLQVTVDFPDSGRKHFIPRYAPSLRPLD